MLNASRRFRYTLDLKKEEDRKQIIRKIRAHAQVIRVFFLSLNLKSFSKENILFSSLFSCIYPLINELWCIRLHIFLKKLGIEQMVLIFL